MFHLFFQKEFNKNKRAASAIAKAALFMVKRFP
jgi:hypothetical protein